jgi:tRNA threonylcarbamoyladenosine modification (KEOPS) complex Cgi121 subunit
MLFINEKERTYLIHLLEKCIEMERKPDKKFDKWYKKVQEESLRSGSSFMCSQPKRTVRNKHNSAIQAAIKALKEYEQNRLERIAKSETETFRIDLKMSAIPSLPTIK